jgi:hypothetical protein
LNDQGELAMTEIDRVRAEEKFAALQRSIPNERERAQRLLAEKVARLRALRLERDGADKEERGR